MHLRLSLTLPHIDMCGSTENALYHCNTTILVCEGGCHAFHVRWLKRLLKTYVRICLQPNSGSPIGLCGNWTHPEPPARLHTASDEHTILRLKDVEGTGQVRKRHRTCEDGQFHLITDPYPVHRSTKQTEYHTQW